MANYQYNGVELPALPEWDKTTYPYAQIHHANSNEITQLTLTKTPCTYYYPNGAYIKCPKPLLYCTVTDGEWSEFAEISGDGDKTQSIKDFAGNTNGVLIWSNHDIINENDSTVYLPASDPVPVPPINADAYIVKGGKLYKVGKLYQARVGADPILQEKTVTENGEFTADEGYEGLSKVTVNVATYITVATEEEATDTATIPIVEGQVIVVTGA